MITSFIGSLLAFLYFKMSFDTINARRSKKISLGVGQSNEIEKYVSAHSNFAAYTPLFLILFFLAENSKEISEVILYAIGFSFVVGRFFHYFGMTAEKMNFKFRVRGMMLTLFPLNIIALVNLFVFLKIRLIDYF